MHLCGFYVNQKLKLISSPIIYPVDVFHGKYTVSHIEYFKMTFKQKNLYH